MPASKSWNGITEAIFSCVKTTSKKQHGTKYEPPDADSGTATTETPVGTVKLSFALVKETLTYEILSKPILVPEAEIWNGIEDTIKACGG